MYIYRGWDYHPLTNSEAPASRGREWSTLGSFKVDPVPQVTFLIAWTPRAGTFLGWDVCGVESMWKLPTQHFHKHIQNVLVFLHLEHFGLIFQTRTYFWSPIQAGPIHILFISHSGLSSESPAAGESLCLDIFGRVLSPFSLETCEIMWNPFIY